METTQEDQPNITIINHQYSATDAIKKIAYNKDDPFYVMDIGELIRKYEDWTVKLPTVKPFYAVKCNHSALVLKVLASLGVCFDCASKAEIDKVLQIKGVNPDRIIFANATKFISHLKHSASIGVNLMTFDNAAELYKIKEHHPNAKLLLRLRCGPARAMRTFGAKFGCEEQMCEELLRIAFELNLAVVGVSFHVGSGCCESVAFYHAICLSRRVFNLALTLGNKMTVLDIGGGFTAQLFNEIADEINKYLEMEFGDLKDVEVIAEPGRYFVSAAFTLATKIHSKREV